MRELTAEERSVLDALGEAWNSYSDLPEIHATKRREFMDAIHAAKDIVHARPSIEQVMAGRLVKRGEEQ